MHSREYFGLHPEVEKAHEGVKLVTSNTHEDIAEYINSGGESGRDPLEVWEEVTKLIIGRSGTSGVGVNRKGSGIKGIIEVDKMIETESAFVRNQSASKKKHQQILKEQSTWHIKYEKYINGEMTDPNGRTLDELSKLKNLAFRKMKEADENIQKAENNIGDHQIHIANLQRHRDSLIEDLVQSFKMMNYELGSTSK